MGFRVQGWNSEFRSPGADLGFVGFFQSQAKARCSEPPLSSLPTLLTWAAWLRLETLTSTYPKTRNPTPPKTPSPKSPNPKPQNPELHQLCDFGASGGLLWAWSFNLIIGIVWGLGYILHPNPQSLKAYTCIPLASSSVPQASAQKSCRRTHRCFSEGIHRVPSRAWVRVLLKGLLRHKGFKTAALGFL